MKEFSKEIKVNSNEKVRYDYIDGISITAINEKDCPNDIKFCRSDDYYFDSWYDIDDEEYYTKKRQLHTFERNHSLYIPLLHLLNGEKELIIDDDDTYELNKKYMRIFLDGDNINIEFIYNLDENLAFNKFCVSIKNIGFDLRSKVDDLGLDTKKRLYLFFNEIGNIFSEEYHQITLEEYLLNNNSLSLEESKKYVKSLKM